MTSKSDALLQISRAETSREVLGLTADEVLSAASLQSQYRKLAILVHPDKNEAENASQCFLKLKDAYESLLASADSSETVDALKEDKRDRTKKRKAYHFSTTSNTNTSAEKFKAFSELFSEEEINSHTENWKRFHSNASPVEAQTESNNTPVSDAVPAKSSPGAKAEGASSTEGHDFICLLCRRRFKSAEQQTKHELASAMHKANLEALHT